MIFFRNSLRKTNISVKIRTFKTCIFYNYSSQDPKFLKIVNFKYKIGTSFKVFQKLKKSPVYKDQIIANNLYEQQSSPVVFISFFEIYLFEKRYFFWFEDFSKEKFTKKRHPKFSTTYKIILVSIKIDFLKLLIIHHMIGHFKMN